MKLQGFNSKLIFADGALIRTMATIEEPRRAMLRERWATLFERLRTQSSTRNELAHWQTEEYPQHTVEGRRIAVRPWIIVKGFDRMKPPDDAKCVMEVQKARLEFESLVFTIENFLAQASQQPEPFPASDEQAQNPLTLRQLRLQIHEALGHPHQSCAEKRRQVDDENAAHSLVNAAAISIGEDDGKQIQGNTPPATVGGQGATADAGDAARPQDAPQEKDCEAP